MEATDCHVQSTRKDATGFVYHNSVREIKDGVWVSDFDYSVENFFDSMEEIAALCGDSGKEKEFDADEIQRFSSMIKFLTEWRQYTYKPRTVNFSYETGSADVKAGRKEISLSHFSSATVPKMEELYNKMRFMDSDDFILHAGGPIWALDWCPTVPEKSQHNIKCEYLAVAAHPPGSTYHKIGVPMVGRGVVQIWCFPHIAEEVEILSPKTIHRGRGRPMKKPIREESPKTIRRGRGRPMKKPIREESLDDVSSEEDVSTAETKGIPKKKCLTNAGGESCVPREPIQDTHDLNSIQEVPLSKPRRPQKIRISGLNDVEEPLLPKPRWRPRKRPIPSASNTRISGLNDVEEPLLPKPRGRPRKRPVPSVSNTPLRVDAGESKITFPASGVNAAGLDAKEETLVLKPKGRPRKKQILCEHECAPPSDAELGKASSALPTFIGLEGSNEKSISNDPAEVALFNVRIESQVIPLALPVFANLNEGQDSAVPKRRGRPRKKPILNAEECVVVSGVELGGLASPYPTSRGLEVSYEKTSIIPSVEPELRSPSSAHLDDKAGTELVPLGLPAFANLSREQDSAVPRRRGRPRKKPITKQCVPTSGFELGGGLSALHTSKGPDDLGLTGLNNFLGEVPSVLPVSADLNRKESFVHKRRRKPRKNSTLVLNKHVPESGIKLPELTFECSHDSSFPDAISQGKEAGRNRLSKADTICDVIPKGIALPKVVLCLAHNGKVVWDLKWRPSNVIHSESEGKPHMGYLAVLLGNGSLEVWEVPLLSMVKTLYASCCSENTDPRFMKLEPVFRCSKVKCGDRQSIPLTMEWSPSAPCNLLLAGCHDGTVAMWKFSTNYSSEDSKPLLCFTADSVPIRALAWAPDESDVEVANLFVTAGHEGLKFWDIRDPYRPLWELNPVQRIVLSLDWLKDPRCIVLSFDDGTVRTISLWKTAYDVHVTGKPSIGSKLQGHGMHCYQCSSFAVWSIQVSRTTGLVAYCSADGTVIHFQLTAKFVDKDKHRHRESHFLCGSLTEEDQCLKITTPSPNTPLLNIPMPTKKPPTNPGNTPQTKCNYLSGAIQAPAADLPMVLGSGSSRTSPARKKVRLIPNPSPVSGEEEQGTPHSSEKKNCEPELKVEVFPPKIVAMHRVRWNMNKGSEKWLCYGGAAGIVRCQEITLPTNSQGSKR